MIEALTSLSAFDKVAGTSFAETAPVQRAAALPVQAAAPAGAEFCDIIAQFATQARDALRMGEATSIAGIKGTASAQQVVEAVMSAEQSLQTVVAIRDKVVAAYLELSRMPI